MSTWKRTFAVVWIANLLTGMGMMSFLPYFPSYLERLGVTDKADVSTWAGLCFGAAPLSAALMGPIWGALGDRFGRKAMVLRSLFALSFFVGLMAFARTPWQLLLLRVGQGLFSGILPPSITLVSIGVPADRRGRVAGGMQTAMAAGAIGGPQIGSFVHGASDPRYLFVGVCVATLVGALLVLFFAREDDSERKQSAEGGRLLQALARDIASLFAIPRLRAAMVLLFCVQFGIGATNPVLELYVREIVPDASPEHAAHLAGNLFSVMSLMLVVSASMWGRAGDRFGHGRALIASAVVACVALIGSGAATVFAFLLAARVVLGVGAGGLGPTAFGLAAVTVPPHARGAANGAVFSSRALALATSSMVGGWLAAQVGIRQLFVWAAVALGAATVLSLPRLAGRSVPAPDR
ncbi:MAG: MFS transporter [Planctomycetota bacterium]